MGQGLKSNELNGREVYSDIIDHPHWQSLTRPHMSLYNRAAQFMPFNALDGYSDIVKELQREAGMQIELEEYETERLNQKLNLISELIKNGERPVLSITYFVPDKYKEGGEYKTVTEEIKRIDPVFHKIVLTRTDDISNSNVKIDIASIIDLHGTVVDFLDEMID